MSFWHLQEGWCLNKLNEERFCIALNFVLRAYATFVEHLFHFVLGWGIDIESNTISLLRMS